MFKLSPLFAAAAIAMAAASPLAVAQTTTPPSTTPSGSMGSPSTPPTHPTERTVPSNTPARPDSAAPGGSDLATPRSGGMAEAIQACRNLSEMQARDECMRRIDADRQGGTSGSDSTGVHGNPSGTAAGRTGNDAGNDMGGNRPYGNDRRGSSMPGSDSMNRGSTGSGTR